MPQQISVPNYGLVEFPDGMSDADISSAIKKNAMGYKSATDQYGRVDGLSVKNILPNAKYLGANAIAEFGNVGNNIIGASSYLPRKIENLVASFRTNKTGARPLNDYVDSLQGANKDLKSELKGTPGSDIAPLAVDMAATGGVGDLLAGGAKLIPMLAKYAPAIASGGFNLGSAATGSKLANAAIRAVAGGATGAASGSILDPDKALTTGMLGAALPTSIKGLGGAGKAIGGLLSNTTAPFTAVGKNKIISEFLINKSGKQYNQVINNLKNADGNTLGFNPTVGQAANSGDLAALERAFMARSPSLFQDVQQTQKNVLANAIRGIGGDDIARQGLVNTRENAVNGLYDTAKNSNVVANDELSALMNRPAIKNAMGAANTNALNRGDSFIKGQSVEGLENAGQRNFDIPESAYYKEFAKEKINGGNEDNLMQSIKKMGGIDLKEILDITGEKTGRAARAQVGIFHKNGLGVDDLASQLYDKGYIPHDEMAVDGGVSYLKDAVRRHIGGDKQYALHDIPSYAPAQGYMRDVTDVAGENPNYFKELGGSNVYSGKSLHELKLALDAQKNFMPASAAEAAAHSGIKSASNDFNSYLDNAIPAYGQAKHKFAELSKPINQLDLGNAIADKYIPASQRDMPSPLQLNREQLAKVFNDNGDKLAAHVTGFKGATLANTLTSKQLLTIKNAIKDGQYLSQGEMLGKGGGSDTTQKLAFNSGMEKAGLVDSLLKFSPLSMGAHTLKSMRDLAYSGANKSLEEQLANALLSPKNTASMMITRQQQLAQKTKYKGLLDDLLPMLNKATPALVNRGQ